MKRIISLTIIATLTGCSSANLDDVKAKACDTWKQAGYTCVGYEGYQWGFGVGNYGGAHVWHSLKRDANPTVIYSGYVQKWGNEYHLYNVTAVDAITQK